MRGLGSRCVVLAGTLVGAVFAMQCGGREIGVEEKRDVRCAGYRATGEDLLACPYAFDETTGRCKVVCGGPFASLIECEFVCERRGCNATQPCPSADDACVFVPYLGTGYCARRCVAGLCPIYDHRNPLGICAPSPPDYPGACSDPCVVCGLDQRLSLRIDPTAVSVTIEQGQTPAALAFNALFSRQGAPEQNVTAQATWQLEDPELGLFTSAGTLAPSGAAGTTIVVATYSPDNKSVPYYVGSSELSVKLVAPP
jgi:hypothetical protein